MIQVGILHGAGYVGRKLIEQVLVHPNLVLNSVTSRSQIDQPVWKAHTHLRNKTAIYFQSELNADVELVFVAAGHGQGAQAVGALRDSGFEGLIVDMSADFRLSNPETYLDRYGAPHPRPDLLKSAWYGMPELTGAPPAGTKLIANPGCFASAISLALNPLTKAKLACPVAVTALTGASGSGAQAKDTTHFPSRNGNVRAYKVFEHQHEAEIDQMAPGLNYAFVPVSGPWTNGIWGVAQTQTSMDVGELFEAAYADKPLIRLWKDEIPELHWSVDSPFTDIGWVQSGKKVVVGVAIDNLMKGAATQAIQNVNLALGFPETLGLLP